MQRMVDPSTELPSNDSNAAPQALVSPPEHKETAHISNNVFYGPSSAEYSMNMVQRKLRDLGYLPSTHPHPVSPSLGEEDANSSPNHWRPSGHCDRHRLLQFRSWLTLQNAKDVLKVYYEVVGALHPFIDPEHMEKQLRAWYSYGPSKSTGSGEEPKNDEDLLILVLMLAIAAQAQGDTVHGRMASVMYSSFEHAANASATSAKASVKQATIVLLLGYYYFSYDLPRLASRMCGIAGRILLELGLHNGDVLNMRLGSEAQRKSACIMMSSVVILDRQWSGMSGLPANFETTTFNPVNTYPTDAPYAHAMYKLIQISDRFNEPITLAAKADGQVDEDAVETLTFQVQQWQRKTVGDLTLSDMESWFGDTSHMPPSWKLLVVFRAASIRSLLMRPYFFPKAEEQRSGQQIIPALKLASQVTRALDQLDRATPIYRNQRPYYQSVLDSTCALMFLIAGYVEEHQDTISQFLPPDYEDQISYYFRLAKGLSEKYADVSKSANSLWRKIRELCSALQTYGSQRHTAIGTPSAPTIDAESPSMTSTSTRQQIQFQASLGSVKESQTNWEHSSLTGFYPWVPESLLGMDFAMAGDGTLQHPESLGSLWLEPDQQSLLFR